MPRWSDLSRLTKVIIGLGAALVSAGTPVAGFLAWADGRYFLRTDGEAVVHEVKQTRLEVRIASLETRESYFAKERAELRRAQTERPLTAIEHDRLLDVERALDRIRQRIAELRSKLDRNGS